MNVSVIIPAHNAADTIAETLDSLCAQTLSSWEAIVVDDGSSDETAAVVNSFSARDARICLVRQPQSGVSAARNSGISRATFDWLLFLDADDWILPTHLERLTSVLASDSDLAGVHCGWARVAADGARMDESFCAQTGDLFAAFAYTCAFAIHACIIRRSIVQAAGNFDTSLRVAEDWDLWQRIARTGARFGAVREVLAFYRMRAHSASVDSFRLLADGLRVLTQGYASDPRVPNPHPDHANGLPGDQLRGKKFYLACWAAGLMVGQSRDARPLLDMLKEDRAPDLDPRRVAMMIFESATLPTCRPPSAWHELWSSAGQQIEDFLAALEAQSQTARLARRVRIMLERMVLSKTLISEPITLGTTHARRLDITEQIPDIHLPTSVERILCIVEADGEHIGMIELPVCDGLVLSSVLADTIAAEFAWQILGLFFAHTVYPDLRVEQHSTGLSLWRGTLQLLPELPVEDRNNYHRWHDQIGWTLFLQELWGRPVWPADRFYDTQLAQGINPEQQAEDDWFMVEISQELPDVEATDPELHILVTMGGVPIEAIHLPAAHKTVQAQNLRVAITMSCGFELCRAAVREGLLGRPLSSRETLRTRLAAAAAQDDRDSLVAQPATKLVIAAGKVPLGIMAVPDLAPGAAAALERALPSSECGIIMGRRQHMAIGTSASRRAMLPAAAAQALTKAAAISGEPVIQIPHTTESFKRIVYVPDLIWRTPRLATTTTKTINTRTLAPAKDIVQASDTAIDLRNQFEAFFAAEMDPWKYTSAYEQTKYEQTLDLVPSGRISRALELACAEGHFTLQLAPRVDRLIAADISQIALDRAAQRCTDLHNIEFARLDLTRDALPGRFDMISCSEMLYYVGGHEALKMVARKLAEALEPGGYLLMAHANLIVDEPDKPGFNWDHAFGAKCIGEVFSATPLLRPVRELHTPAYRIQLFQRDDNRHLTSHENAPELIEMELTAPLPPAAAEQFLWAGGQFSSLPIPEPVVTTQLPILMYHSIAPTGSPATARYRTTPEAFEEQMRYLHESGFYSITLEDWRLAMEAKRPLPGRAVLLTFDDGYLDFQQYAWPILKRYGFSATVFLVAEKVGATNEWDSIYGETLPLLGWDQIRQLQSEGVIFGSHTATHPALTGLSNGEIAQEGLRSRAILERELGHINALAYPYGDMDSTVERLIGACGYSFGLSCRWGLSSFGDRLLALPRIEITGADRLQQFVLKVAS